MTTNTTTPSRKEMIQAIEKVVANKELSFGCRIVENNTIYNIQDVYGCYMSFDGDIYLEGGDSEDDRKVKIEKVIGHPVMIGDVIDYFIFDIIDHGSYGYEVKRDFYEIFNMWEEKRKPITEQSDDCVKFVYNLIS